VFAERGDVSSSNSSFEGNLMMECIGYGEQGSGRNIMDKTAFDPFYFLYLRVSRVGEVKELFIRYRVESIFYFFSEELGVLEDGSK